MGKLSLIPNHENSICPVKRSKKGAAKERRISQAKAEVWEDRKHLDGQNYCAGCGANRSGGLEISHRIGVGQSEALCADKENMDVACRVCHRLIEAGRYHELPNRDFAIEVALYIRDHFNIKYQNSVKAFGSIID